MKISDSFYIFENMIYTNQSQFGHLKYGVARIGFGWHWQGINLVLFQIKWFAYNRTVVTVNGLILLFYVGNKRDTSKYKVEKR